MTSLTRDPLLAIAKGILWFLMGAMALAAVGCLIAIPLLHVFQHDITIELAKEAPKLSTPDFIWIMTGVLIGVIALVAILFRLFQLLKRIVDTVGLGDPFLPENAARLTQMAWLTLAMQVISFGLGSAASWLDKIAGDAPHIRTEIQFDDGLSGNGLLLMLILFILARVFRQGAAMRAELEGTV